MLIKIAMP